MLHFHQYLSWNYFIKLTLWISYQCQKDKLCKFSKQLKHIQESYVHFCSYFKCYQMYFFFEHVLLGWLPILTSPKNIPKYSCNLLRLMLMQDPTFVGYPVGPVLKHFYVILPGLSEKFSFICTLSMFLEKDLIWLKKVFLPKISSNDLNQICKIRVSSSVFVCVCFFFGEGGGAEGDPPLPK